MDMESNSAGKRASIIVNTWSVSHIPLAKSKKELNLDNGIKIYSDNVTETFSIRKPKSIRKGDDSDAEYSFSEYSASFRIVTPRSGRKITVFNDDTDVEEDDDFKEYSGVTIEKSKNDINDVKSVKRRPVSYVSSSPACDRSRKTVSLNVGCSKPPSGLQSSHCLSNCASTYHNYRTRRKTLSSMIDSGRTSDDSFEESPAITKKEKIRRPKKKRSGPWPVEGTWELVGNINYEEFLAEVGTGARSRELAMRATQILRIQQDPDKQWRLSTETVIRAKSSRGYRTSSRKWTENKFKAGEPKPELLEDWDPRLVVTSLEVGTEGDRIDLHQVAEKDQRCCVDSETIMEVEGEDVLVITLLAGEIVAWRKFQKKKPIIKTVWSSRKISSPI